MKNRRRGSSLISALASRASVLSLLVAGFTLAASAPEACADELTRRLQEELRKRNLYFGDIDGRVSESFGHALRRYQQRKGFTPTGSPDEQTVTSLGLSSASASTPGDTGQADASWPDVPVLRSHAAREVAENDRAMLEQIEPTEPEPTPVAEAPDADLESETALVTIPDFAPTAKERPAEKQSPDARAEKSAKKSIPPQSAPEKPSRPPASAPPRTENVASSTAEIERFVHEYLAACETNRIPAEMAFYADRVNYFDHGTVGHSFLEQDLRRYYKRWPRRDFTLERLKVLPPAPGEEEFTVKFHIYFDLKGGEGLAKGRTENTFKVRREGDGLKFTYLRERRLGG